MNLKLTKSEEDILKLFWSLKSKYHVAALLEISYSTIVYLLYRRDRPVGYTSFSIRKKSGGVREIHAPISSLKILQRKLSYIFYLVYRPRLSVFGFCKRKNIVGNASLHTRKKVLFNLDLKDFFPSIHIGRVIGLFKAKPFSFPHEVAVLLAQLCCHEGKLPQGAPTSPILANMICVGLDTELQALAKESHAVYTRYADDISFSTSARNLSSDIATTNSDGIVVCGDKLKSIIEKQGFQINYGKVRLQTPRGRQEATGLIVNEFVNLPRQKIREVRAMLHVWRKFGEAAAGKRFYDQHDTKFRSPSKKKADFSAIVGGKLSFIRLVRGEKDAIYRKLLNKRNLIINPGALPLPVDLLDELRDSLWIIRTAAGYTGTAFLLKKSGLVTCAHVVGEDHKVTAIHWRSGTSYDAIVLKKHATADLAVLEIVNISSYDKFTSLDRSSSGTVKERETVSVAGFPDYQPADPPQCWDVKVSARRPDSTGGNGIYVERFVIDKMLLGGMSGSPVVNKDNKVVAVATYGSTTVKEAAKIWDYGITPIYHLDNIA